jgi:hypothetical protein
MVFNDHLSLEFSSAFCPESLDRDVSLKFTPTGDVKVAGAHDTPHTASKIYEITLHFGNDLRSFGNVKHRAGKSAPQLALNAHQSLRLNFTPKECPLGDEKVKQKSMERLFQGGVFFALFKPAPAERFQIVNSALQRIGHLSPQAFCLQVILPLTKEYCTVLVIFYRLTGVYTLRVFIFWVFGKG